MIDGDDVAAAKPLLCNAQKCADAFLLVRIGGDVIIVVIAHATHAAARTLEAKFFFTVKHKYAKRMRVCL
ncbi:MAG: hypothetical protein V3S36_07930, partial [Acidiferrobacterales bacterium]